MGFSPLGMSAIETAGITAMLALMLLFRKRLASFFPNLAVDLTRFAGSSEPGVVLFASSGLITLGAIAVFWAIAHGLGLPLEFGASLLLLPVAMLLSALPISLAGWGIREAAVVAAFSLVGLAPSDALIVSVLYGVTTPALGLVAVLAELAVGLNLRAAAAEESARSIQ
jgi:uncharacterized membrane protein YbhN (UPF0104 family)